MKTFKLCAVTAVGLMAFGAANLQAQIGNFPFQSNDVQSVTFAVTALQQKTNYSNANATKNTATTKTVKYNNAGLLTLLSEAFTGTNNSYAKAGRTNYTVQLYLQSTNAEYVNYEYYDWYVQVVKVVGSTKTIVLDTYTAAAFNPYGSENEAYAYMDIEFDSGPISGTSGNGSGSATSTGQGWFELYWYYYDSDDNYYSPFDIYGQGVMTQKFSGNSKGDNYSFTIKNISGEDESYNPSNDAWSLDSVITGGTISGSGKDSGGN